MNSSRFMVIHVGLRCRGRVGGRVRIRDMVHVGHTIIHVRRVNVQCNLYNVQIHVVPICIHVHAHACHTCMY